VQYSLILGWLEIWESIGTTAQKKNTWCDLFARYNAVEIATCEAPPLTCPKSLIIIMFLGFTMFGIISYFVIGYQDNVIALNYFIITKTHKFGKTSFQFNIIEIINETIETNDIIFQA
jgi:hypothetical protein